MRIGTRSLQSDYNQQADSLYLYKPKEKPDSSLEIGNIIIDFAKDGSVVGLEFLNASTTLPPLFVVYSPEAIDPEKKVKAGFFEKISKAQVSVDTESDLFIITISMYIENHEARAALTVPVMTRTQVQIARKVAAFA